MTRLWLRQKGTRHDAAFLATGEGRLILHARLNKGGHEVIHMLRHHVADKGWEMPYGCSSQSALPRSTLTCKRFLHERSGRGATTVATEVNPGFCRPRVSPPLGGLCLLPLSERRAYACMYTA